ncbi:MAG: response regulator transcription factor [Elusimicrobiota bacterium]
MARILSVEDDGEFQQVLGFFLRREGYDVHYAFTGQEGYEKALSLRPDLILLDMMLPVMNGPEIIRRLKAQPETRDIPIIVMTAYYKNIEFLEKKVKPMGVLEYLRKPVEMKELRSLVRKALASRPHTPPAPEAEPLRRGDIRLEPATRTVWIEDKLVATLPPKRFAVLAELARQDGPVGREHLLTRVWKDDGNENTLEKTIERLRRDLGPEGARRIRTTEDGYELA